MANSADDFQSGLREECAVFGCVAAGPWPSTKIDVAALIVDGLLGMQHRGQESTGLVVGTGNESDRMHSHKGMGLVGAVYREADLMYLKGNLGIGHNRYSTAGRSHLVNCQPLILTTMYGEIAIGHNGEIVNARDLRDKIFMHGGAFASESDTELIVRALMLLHKNSVFGSARSRSSSRCDINSAEGTRVMSPSLLNTPPDWDRRIAELMDMYPLAYSFLLFHGDAVYAVRDCFGNRPLILGKILSRENEGAKGESVDAWVVASESCCFKNLPNCRAFREVLPGEVVKITKEGFSTVARVGMPGMPPVDDPDRCVEKSAKTAFCLFEYVYFARGDSFFEGQQVYSVRERCGQRLAIEAPVCADIVSNVPDSSTPAALGFSYQSKIPYKEVFLKNPYVGRTFIQPSTRQRQSAVSKKFGTLSENYAGKRIVLIDDSIVRGNTLQGIVKLLKDTGAKEVHVRIASPPVKFPCYMGIAVPTREELVANQIPLNKLPRHLGADSVEYLSIDGLIETVQEGAQRHDFRGDAPNWKRVERGYCSACFTGDYPVRPHDITW